MQTIHSNAGKRHVARMSGLVVGTVALLTAPMADAHFVLRAPANWMMQDSAGAPEKLGPCGNETPQTPTNAVTAYRPGDQVTIQFDEVVPHPGHYRVALAPTQSDLPPEPTVTSTAQDPCASAAVQNNLALPILADNVLPHTAVLAGTQTITVTLPSNPPCTDCVLQVIEFMSSHTQPCFYHHCANITIGAPGDAGGSSGSSDGGAAPPAADGGCSCSLGRRGDSPFAGAPLACIAAAIAARRRSRRRWMKAR